MIELDIFKSDLRPMEFWADQLEQKVALWEKGIIEGYSTGFKTLDWHVRLVKGELIVIAARPSMGKSALAMQIVENMATEWQQNGERGVCAVFSAEMSGWSLQMRMAGAISSTDTHRLRMGKGTPDEIARFRDAIRKIRSLPIWIDDNSSPTTAQMLTQLSRLNETIPVRAMMFDFMELGGDKTNTNSGEQRISQIAKSLKGIAKTLQIPVISLNQLNRDVESRANKMPNLDDLRASGMIEQVADQVLFIMRPEYYFETGQTVSDVPEDDKKRTAYISVAKSRNGPRGVLKLQFCKEKVMFSDPEYKEPPPGNTRQDWRDN